VTTMTGRDARTLGPLCAGMAVWVLVFAVNAAVVLR
jgi:hypothetical protein